MNEIEMLRYMIDLYDKKLKELLPEDEYHEFTVNAAKEAFKHELDGMADGDFKRFCLDNFDKITEVEE